MFIQFFYELRRAGLPVSLKEFLLLLSAVEKGCAGGRVDDFYHLSRACLIKDERHLDRFDVVFGQVFRGLETVAAMLEAVEGTIPEEWLRRLVERTFTPEEVSRVQALGGFDKLMETLAQRLREQQERHQGGSKWIGTAGTSPFGAWGFNPEGVRIGQGESRHRSAVKVWDRREFRNLDDQVELGTRNIKLALRRLRRFARQGAVQELDLPGTIRDTARNAGWLDLRMVPERHNTVKVLLFLDIGGSMDDHVALCAELFSAARSEFKHLDYYYFHNMVYESVWKDNRRRHEEQIPTFDVIHTYAPDTKLVFVGDAAMSPYEIVYEGGSTEHWNLEPGRVWLNRLLTRFPHVVWLNPTPHNLWSRYQSTQLLYKQMAGRMYPLTLEGLDEAAQALMGAGMILPVS